MKTRTILILITTVFLSMGNGLFADANGVAVNITMINLVLAQQQAAADAAAAAAAAAAASRPPLGVAVAATFGDALGRPPTATEIHDGVSYIQGGGNMDSLRAAYATTPEATSNIAAKVKDATGNEASQADINNGIQHIMTGGTVNGFSHAMGELGTSAVPNVDNNLRDTIRKNSIDQAGRAMSNPSQTLGQ